MISPLQKPLLKPMNIILALNLLRNTFQKKQQNNNDFNIKATSIWQINKIIKDLNPKKATVPDKIPVNILKLATSVMNCHLTNIINNDLSNNAFSDSAKLASVRPIYKNDNTNEIKDCRTVSIWNCFSKIYEKVLNE